MERIRQDRRKAPTQIQPLLAYLETHLFDPDLDANQLKRACGVRDNSLPIYFHHAVSLPPYAYIEDCRLEIACRLLSASELKIWQIAQLLGYSTLQVFSRAFHRWSGLRPSVFRRRSRQDQATSETLAGKPAPQKLDAADEADSLISMSTLRKAVSGGLDREEADTLARRMARLYPDSFQGPEAASACADGSFELAADQAWTLLKDRPAAERRDLVKKRWRLASVELFRLLVQRSIESSRNDVQRGVELSEAAIDCLDALRGQIDRPLFERLQAEGWTWVANARRRARDFPNAEEALGRAELAIKPVTDADVRTAFLIVKSSLRMEQRRLDEAQKLADRAVAMLETTADPKLGVMGLAHRANLFLMMEQPEDAVADYWHGRKLADQIEDKYLRATVYQGLTVSLAKLGRHQQVARFLPVARALFQELAFHKALCHLEWTEAFIAWDLGRLDLAENHFTTARKGFIDEDEAYESAMVALDLALLYSEQGKSADVLRLVSEVIPVFASLKVHREALMAVRLLEQAVAAQEVSTATLKKVRDLAAKARSY
ncbi:MAG TPA: AraC family transcriptional regulator [Thermoanaerobaculia bacterium]|jgi:AraC-like DNA-binding protein